MTTALDTNVLVGLWDDDKAWSDAARAALDHALSQGPLVLSGAVYAELLACPGRTEDMLDRFLADVAIRVDWDFGEQEWRLAGNAFQAYTKRRRLGRGTGPRRILADFVIGAHAQFHRYRLLTFDDRHHRAAFPGLRVLLAGE